MKRVVPGLLALLAALPAAAQELVVPNPYDASTMLPYEDAFAASRTALSLPPWLELSGRFRLRGMTASGLDLDRGATPSGETILGTEEGMGGDFSSADMRLVVLPVLHTGPEVALRSRLVFFDNLVLGSTPSAYPATADMPMPAGTTTQSAPRSGVNSVSDSFVVDALWLEWLSPVGMVVAGRTTADWGLGMVASSGGCADCDVLQTTDRIGFVTSLFGVLVAVSCDFDANGGTGGSFDRPLGTLHDLTDRDDLRTWNVAVTRYHSPRAAARKIAAGRTLLNWGLSFSYRAQDLDLPAYYFTDPADWDGDASEDELVHRGLAAWLVDGWFRLATVHLLVEGEGAYLDTSLDNASLLAGMSTAGVEGHQWGGVLRVKVRTADAALSVGAEVGAASGDAAYGFGAHPGTSFSPEAGDMDGAQADLKTDRAVDNFRFNPNFHVDEILWRRIVGTVTDALYVKGAVAAAPAAWAKLEAAAVYSRAMHAQSAPGIARDLGVEGDLRAVFSMRDGMELALVGAMLYPLDGFRNVLTATDPSPAWLGRVLVSVRF